MPTPKERSAKWREEHPGRSDALNKLNACRRKWENRAKLSRKKILKINAADTCPICGADISKTWLQLQEFRICDECGTHLRYFDYDPDYLTMIAALLHLSTKDYSLDLPSNNEVKDKYKNIREYLNSYDYRYEKMQAMRSVEEYKASFP